MKPTYLARLADAEQQLRATGGRLTQPRVAVLAMLMAANHAISHHEVAAGVATRQPIDRVTVYRVLDWLVDAGIAHRIAGDDRVWRFMLSRDHAGSKPEVKHQHAHFTCNQCGQTFCLNDLPARVNFKLPDGFKSSEVDVKIRGACAHCS
jgi:Fur family ferric uptake transcriptional regulator